MSNKLRERHRRIDLAFRPGRHGPLVLRESHDASLITR